MTDRSHKGLVLDQFTRQATVFSTAAPITNADALRMIIEAARPGPDDRVLDVACGGGIVVCAFAPRVRRATGIDVTPAMLGQAHALAAEKGLTNVEWQQGDVTSLPFDDDSFTIVVTRFAMHHFPDPAAVLREIGARDWFARLQQRHTADTTPRYCADREALTLPTLSLQVRDVRPAGPRPVFDLAVDDLHAFIASTVGVHNCIGNSGPLKPEISAAVKEGDLTAASVLSGNRNFEGRVHPETRMNFLASPPLVVAYALAGTLDIDLTREPLGTDKDGKPVYLADIWPSDAEIQELAARSIDSQMFRQSYASVFKGDENWANINVPTGQRYTWDEKSTYVKNPPYFDGMTMQLKPLADVRAARVLAVLGDSVTTDHISPAGNISKSSPAARYLIEQGVEPKDFNSYGARRGNHEVMMRGTFANIRLRNLMVPGVEGGVTLHLPEGERSSIYDIAMRYQREGTPLVVLAGREYGTGSSRDWAAKGTMLLGVKAVIAESFERIHRSNLIGMGVAPLQFLPGENVASLGLTGREIIDIAGLSRGDATEVTVTATRPDGAPRKFNVRVRIDTPKEREYYRHGGILQYVLRQLAAAGGAA